MQKSFRVPIRMSLIINSRNLDAFSSRGQRRLSLLICAPSFPPRSSFLAQSGQAV
jgi:hypothetical protein